MGYVSIVSLRAKFDNVSSSTPERRGTKGALKRPEMPVFPLNKPLLRRRLLTFLTAVYVMVGGSGLALPSATDVACREALDPLSSSLNGHVNFSAFQTGRNLGSYAELLPVEFVRALVALGLEAHWLDAGSGEGLATIDYLMGRQDNSDSDYGAAPETREALQRLNERPTSQRARTTGVTYKYKTDHWAAGLAEPRRAVLGKTGRGRWLEGRYFEDIPDTEIGPAELITDVFGVLAYAPRLDEVVRKYLRLLRDDGFAFIHLGLPGEGSVDDRIWIWRDGARLGLVEWLQSISGVQARKIEFGTGTYGTRKARALELRRTSPSPLVPSLELIEYKDGAPPYREYREKR